MDEPNRESQRKERPGLNTNNGNRWDRPIELLSGALVLVGLILAFFYIHLGGALLGLGFGICFYEEIYRYLLQVRNYYTEKGLVKTLILITAILYGLIAIPLFIIAVAVGFCAVFLTRRALKK